MQAKIRLHGIDAPELAQHCGDPPWPCGRAARDRLADLTAGQIVSCAPRDRDRYGRIVARCSVAGPGTGAGGSRRGRASGWRTTMSWNHSPA